jgi:palmitoyltransferase ZDHHC1/11
MRKNGFSLPLNCIQVLAWVIFAGLSFSFYFWYLPLNPHRYFPVISIPYTVLLFTVIFLAFKVTICNPIDPLVTGMPNTVQKTSKRCTVCLSSVSNSSKHCGKCDKCVLGFDHHCKVLNNCIGAANYVLFFWLLVTVEFFLLLQTATGFYSASTLTDSYPMMGIVLAGSATSFVLLVANGLLIGFHCWLRLKKMTTYDYVVQNRSKQIVPQAEAARLGGAYILNSPHHKNRTPSVSAGQLTNM